MNSRERRDLAFIAKRKDAGPALAAYLSLKSKAVRPSAMRAEKAKKRLLGKEAMRSLRAEVFARAGSVCEVHDGIGRCDQPAVVLDHWLGGSGRRRQKQTVGTTWGLCFACDRHRTANIPGAAYWNKAFQRQCIRHGYTFVPHVEHAQLRPRTAGVG